MNANYVAKHLHRKRTWMNISKKFIQRLRILGNNYVAKDLNKKRDLNEHFKKVYTEFKNSKNGSI